MATPYTTQPLGQVLEVAVVDEVVVVELEVVEVVVYVEDE